MKRILFVCSLLFMLAAIPSHADSYENNITIKSFEWDATSGKLNIFIDNAPNLDRYYQFNGVGNQENARALLSVVLTAYSMSQKIDIYYSGSNAATSTTTVRLPVQLLAIKIHP